MGRAYLSPQRSTIVRNRGGGGWVKAQGSPSNSLRANPRNCSVSQPSTPSSIALYCGDRAGGGNGRGGGKWLAEDARGTGTGNADIDSTFRVFVVTNFGIACSADSFLSAERAGNSASIA